MPRVMPGGGITKEELKEELAGLEHRTKKDLKEELAGAEHRIGLRFDSLEERLDRLEKKLLAPDERD